MYKFTKRREQKALQILECAYESLAAHGAFCVHTFERELRECWHIGYYEFYQVHEDAYRDEWWRYVAVYYFEHQAPRPTCEHQRALAKAYGIARYCADATGIACARKAFWKKSGLTVCCTP